jgi:perosamine synthetase
VDLDPITEIAGKFGLPVIEDATESLGAKYKDRFVGQLGDIACFSFNGNKILTCGGGGMIVTDNESWATRSRYLTTQAKNDPVEFIHGEIGYNYRLTNVQAAMGCAQLEQLDAYVARKRKIAGDYRAALSEVGGLTCMDEAPWAFSTHWLFTILVDEAQFGRSSRSLMDCLADSGVQSRPLWQPMHLSPPYRGAQSLQTGIAERLNRDALCLPSSVGLTSSDFERVVDAVREAARSSR